MPKPHSLQQRLLLSLCSLTFCAALIAAGASAYISFRKHQAFQDRILGMAVMEGGDKAHSPPPPPPEEHIILQTPHSAQIVPLQDVADGYHLFKQGERRYRGFVHTRADKRRVAALQAVEQRNHRALRAALSSAAPFLLLMPLLAWFSARILRRSFAPINALARRLDKEEALPLSLDTAELPLEIQPYTRAINRLLARNAHFVQEQRRFIAAAAHEMRTPLAVLTLQAERLAAQHLPAQAQAEVAALQAGIRRNRALLEQLLSLARSQDGHSEEGECGSHAVFRLVLEQLLPLAEAAGSDIGIRAESRELRVALPQEVLYTLIKNLADNALRHSPPGSRIDLCAQREAEHLVFSVEDNGGGIPEAAREALTAPFARAEDSRSEGSGLGLAIVKTLAQKYGGRLELQAARHFPSGLRAVLIFPPASAR